jgi:hypothetical protein
MAPSNAAPAAAADFPMIPLSPKRHRDKEKREVSRTREAQALLSSHRNMNYNIHSAADFRSLQRGTGEPAGSTSQQHLPDRSAELWTTYHKDSRSRQRLQGPNKPREAACPPTLAQLHNKQAGAPQPKDGLRSALEPSIAVMSRCLGHQAVGQKPTANHAIAATRQPMLIFFSTVRPTDRPSPPNTSDTHG